MKANRAIYFKNEQDRKLFESEDEAKWMGNYSHTVAQFEKLLDERPSEQVLQDFLEHHPYLLPGIHALHCGPVAGVVVTKFPLGNSFRTDFAFASFNSQEVRVTCVEIESAKKNLFRKDGSFSRDYLDAKQQIKDWLFWAQNNISQALDCWRPLMGSYWQNAYTARFQGFLVFGRRSEIDNLKRHERWQAEAVSSSSGLITMTYDRLIEKKGRIYVDPENEKIIVCSYRDRIFRVKRVCV